MTKRVGESTGRRQRKMASDRAMSSANQGPRTKDQGRALPDQFLGRDVEAVEIHEDAPFLVGSVHRRATGPGQSLSWRDPLSARNGPTRHSQVTSRNQDLLAFRTAAVGFPTLAGTIGPDNPATSSRPDGLCRN